MDNLPILLAEDNADDVFLIKRAFHKAELDDQLHIVSGGEEALAYLRGEGRFADRQQHPFPSLVLLDLKMPGLGGMETLAAIRRDPRLKRLVVIILTSSSHDQDVNEAFDLQANSYLVKPRSTDGMVETLEKIKAYWLDMNHYPQCPAPAA